ncbi:MAG: hypothetical protein COA54_02950 [Thiotrichaceae bacterium]|nr:MAG: hypothetical protein COA54_02950 [Thiotrichaceae bacterium]
MLDKITLNNFAAFEKLSIDFSPKVNVIIGENSCGKTQLLKAAYVLSTTGTAFSGDEKITKSKVEQVLTDRLIHVYKPTENKLGELYNRGGSGKAEITAEFTSSGQLGAEFTSRSSKVQVKGNHKTPFSQGAVYLPAKEVLSFLDGISNENSDPATLNRLFDMTYFDLTDKLLEQQRDEVEEKTVWFREAITNQLGGQFLFDDTTVCFKEGVYKDYKDKHASKSYFAPSSKHSLSATMTAEGYRKIGVLQRLLENQAIGTGVNGPLLWDEPESNMNPKLMQMLVDIILELSRKGQQIIIATHDYVLLKWFDLLADKGKDDYVRFHTLYRDQKSEKIKLETTDNYREITPNSIADSYSDLTDHEISKTMGGLGK